MQSKENQYIQQNPPPMGLPNFISFFFVLFSIPQCLFIKLTVENLNSTSFIPKLDHLKNHAYPKLRQYPYLTTIK
jgi:hypothetical protein